MSETNTPIPGVPNNLQELIQGDQTGYQVKMAYLLQLEHGLMGFFPAIIEAEDEIVITLDPALLKKVWETLTPRRSKMDSNLFYVNEELMVGFPFLGPSDHDRESSEPTKILTQEKFDALMAADPHPFKWAPGLVGPGMTREEFVDTIQAAAKDAGVRLPA